MNVSLKSAIAIGIAVTACVATPVRAQGATPPVVTAQAKGVVKTMKEPVDAEVRSVNQATGKIALKHGDLKELDMSSMTMVFEAKDKALLDGLKPGDKVKFRASDNDGKLTVIELKRVN